MHSACPAKIPILGGVPNDDVFLNSDLESAFDTSVINKKIVNYAQILYHSHKKTNICANERKYTKGLYSDSQTKK